MFLLFASPAHALAFAGISIGTIAIVGYLGGIGWQIFRHAQRRYSSCPYCNSVNIHQYMGRGECSDCGREWSY